MYTGTIDILCTLRRSNYNNIENVVPWSKEKNAYTYTDHNPVIAHPPCQQWSRLRAFAKPDIAEKELAIWCMDIVNRNGGIFEHPAGSLVWKQGMCNKGKIISINQSWFGHQVTKRTYLYFVKCSPLAAPITFDAVTRKFKNLSPKQRNSTPTALTAWLIDCIRQTFPGSDITKP